MKQKNAHLKILNAALELLIHETSQMIMGWIWGSIVQ